MSLTDIEWTDITWNVVSGCDKVSAGCRNCYASPTAHRLAGNPNPKVAAAYAGVTERTGAAAPTWTGLVRCLPARLALPFSLTQPSKIFVNSMSDLFHRDVPLEFLARVFEVMAACPWHVFQILTKRAGRLAALAPELPRPPNVWMGVSVEDEDARWRVDCLRRVPAAVRFLSCEPLLGPLPLDLTGIGWVITGGESGPGARPFDPAWAAAIRDTCRAAGVPLLHKQNGGRNKKKTGRELDGRLHDEFPQYTPPPVPPKHVREALVRQLVPEASTSVDRIALSVVK